MHGIGLRTLLVPTALLTLAAVAAGCRSESDATPPRDVTPPHVISRYPATGDAEGTGPFVVTFDEPLDAATVTPDEVQVFQSSGAIPSSVALSADGKTVTVTPAVPLAIPGWVHVKLGAGLRDRAGNAFQVEPSPWLFQMPVWGRVGGPGPISSSDGSNPHASIALDVLGRPVVGMANLTPFAVRFEQGAWVVLPTPSSTIHASIAAGPNGEVWHADAGWQGIAVHRLTEEGWALVAPPITVQDGRHPWTPRVAPTPSGPVVAWAEGISNGEGGLSGTAARADAFREGAWMGWGDGAGAHHAAVGASASGVAYAAWTLTGATVARLGDTIELLPSPASSVVGQASVAVADDGSPLVAYADGAVRVKRWEGESWVAVGGALGDGNASNTAIALDAAGHPVVAWNEGASGLLVARWTGATWERLGGPLNADLAHDAYDVALALDAYGLPVVAWAEATGETRVDDGGIAHPLYQFHASRMNR